MVELTSELFNIFANNILDYRERFELKGDHKDYILEALENLPESKTIYHIEVSGNIYTLWRRKAWLTDIEYRKKLEADRIAYDDALYQRKAKFKELCLGMCSLLGLEPEMADTDMIRRVAEKAMKKRSKQAEDLLGIDLQSVPELPRPHTVYDDRGRKDYTI